MGGEYRRRTKVSTDIDATHTKHAGELCERLHLLKRRPLTSHRLGAKVSSIVDLLRLGFDVGHFGNLYDGWRECVEMWRQMDQLLDDWLCSRLHKGGWSESLSLVPDAC